MLLKQMKRRRNLMGLPLNSMLPNKNKRRSAQRLLFVWNFIDCPTPDRFWDEGRLMNLSPPALVCLK